MSEITSHDQNTLSAHRDWLLSKIRQADAAAKLMGIDQPKVSAMRAGRFRGYSVERLMRFLVALGHDVEIVVSR